MGPKLITKVRQLRSFTLIILIKKKKKKKKSTPEFVGEIRSIDWQRFQLVNQVYSQGHGTVCVFIKQVVHEDIWYFSYKMSESQFLSQAMKDEKIYHAANRFV